AVAGGGRDRDTCGHRRGHEHRGHRQPDHATEHVEPSLGLRGRPHARPVSDGDGGRHAGSRRSSWAMNASAVRATTPMMTMAPKTPSGLKLFCEVAMTRPSPFWAPRNSPTIAPMIEKPKATCRLAMIQTSADGTTTTRTTCHRDAPSTQAIATTAQPTSRTPRHALKKTAKTARTPASRALDAAPRPTATTEI